MPIASTIAIYGITWWIVLFAILPIGVTSQEEDGEITLGTERGAPSRPRILWKVLVTTLVAVPVAIALRAFILYFD